MQIARANNFSTPLINEMPKLSPNVYICISDIQNVYQYHNEHFSPQNCHNCKFEKQKTKTYHNKCQSYLVKRFCITRIFITGNK